MVVSFAPHFLGNEIVHAHDEDVFVVTAIEHDDFTRRRYLAVYAPEIVVIELDRRRLLERHDAHAGRIEAAHHMPNGSIFPRCIHPLQNDEDLVLMLRVEQLLQLGQALLRLFALRERLVLVVDELCFVRIEIVQVNMRSRFDAITFCLGIRHSRILST